VSGGETCDHCNVTEGYSLREVGKLLGLSRSIVSRLIDAGFVAPSRGRRREYRFSFHDLVLLRAAQGLAEAKIPSARILRSLRRLRAQLPTQIPLSGLRIGAVGDSVVVSEGEGHWQAEDGQYVFRFQVENAGGHLAFFDSPQESQPAPPVDWFERGLALEATDVEQSCAAYRKAIAADAAEPAAYINLGRLLHEQGRLRDAEAVYREGAARCSADGTLLFNLAVLLEDLERTEEAAAMYRAALAAAPDLVDAHYNLARLCEAEGSRQEALRHWSAFRKLTGAR
jgi:tetratricopeptide (TPR) repeat protein